MPPTWQAIHEGEMVEPELDQPRGRSGEQGKKGKRTCEQFHAQAAGVFVPETEVAAKAGATRLDMRPIGARRRVLDPAAAAGAALDAAEPCAAESDQPRAAGGTLGAVPKTKAAAPCMRTKRGCRGGRKRQRRIAPTSEVSSTEGVVAALGEG